MTKPQALIVAGAVTFVLVGLYVQTVVQQRSAAEEVRLLRAEFREANRVNHEKIRRLENLLREQEKLSEQQRRELDRIQGKQKGDFPIAKPRPFIDPSKNSPGRD